MKLHFDNSQEYQSQAVKAVTDLFEGQPLPLDTFESTYGSLGYSEFGFGNNLFLTEEQIFANVKSIQQANSIPVTDELKGMNFSVEMETGTGKTYVYIKTIYELNKLYGFTKFVVVVPSIAIKEGVFKNLEITYDHFQTFYNRVPLNFAVYDSKAIPSLRNFATTNTIQILIINIDSFSKDDNIINKSNDKISNGRKPIEFIQACNPIVIIDEPQNIETDIRKRAISNLNPLCTLRYSATHTNPYNLLYSLNPVNAYNLGLVKQIEVDSVISENAMNEAYIHLEKIHSTKNRVTARIKIDFNSDKGVAKKTIVAKFKDDLYKLSNQREIYKDGFIIDGIDAGTNLILFTNGLSLAVGETNGGLTDEIMKTMIQKTVEEHLQKEKDYKGKKIKVLSLFFIDRVKNYKDYDQAGNPIKGKFAEWFEEIYHQEIRRSKFADLVTYPVDIVHGGYFSTDSKKRLKDTGAEVSADDDIYRLIMQDKERLLDEETPLRFIFSHSALREGWDNPNVFQICTLNETKSEVKKRQEIGRGLRLPVDQEGERIFDKNINRLTVIANESYEDFAKALQKEISEECGVLFTGLKNKRARTKVNMRKGFEADPKFLQMWDKIKVQSRYSVSYDSQALIARASQEIKDNMPGIKKPSIRSIKKRLLMDNTGISGLVISENSNSISGPAFEVPDALAYIQNKTGLTRSTVFEILKQSGRINELLINPQLFMDSVVGFIKTELNKLMVDGIKYEPIDDMVYKMSLFDDTNLEVYFDKDDFIVTNPNKTIYENLIPLDSGVENKFAGECESNVNVEFYFKLPSEFKIATPIGTYNPDWAVVFENENKIFFIVETKGKDQELLDSEKMKIKCGKAYFNGLDGVSYIRASTVSDLYN